jgi:hypothetical protein
VQSLTGHGEDEGEEVRKQVTPLLRYETSPAGIEQYLKDETELNPVTRNSKEKWNLSSSPVEIIRESMRELSS